MNGVPAAAAEVLDRLFRALPGLARVDAGSPLGDSIEARRGWLPLTARCVLCVRGRVLMILVVHPSPLIDVDGPRWLDVCGQCYSGLLELTGVDDGDLLAWYREWQARQVAACCGLHGRNCEPPYELCCDSCTEADHPAHRQLGPCSRPDLSPNTLTALAVSERRRDAGEDVRGAGVREDVPGAGS